MFNDQLVAIANALVAHCQAGDESKALDTLYADDAVSIEAAQMAEGAPRTFEGLDAIRAKHDYWNASNEVHEVTVDGPYFHEGDRFAVNFGLDVTPKESGERMQMKEVAVYTVAGGKIVREEFYFPAIPG